LAATAHGRIGPLAVDLVRSEDKHAVIGEALGDVTLLVRVVRSRCVVSLGWLGGD